MPGSEKCGGRISIYPELDHLRGDNNSIEGVQTRWGIKAGGRRADGSLKSPLYILEFYSSRGNKLFDLAPTEEDAAVLERGARQVLTDCGAV